MLSAVSSSVSSSVSAVDHLDAIVDAVGGLQHFGIPASLRPQLPPSLKTRFPSFSVLEKEYENKSVTWRNQRHSNYGKNVCPFLRDVEAEEVVAIAIDNKNEKTVKAIATVATKRDQAEASEVLELVKDLETEARVVLQMLRDSVSQRNNELILNNSAEAHVFWAVAQERKKEREEQRKKALENSSMSMSSSSQVPQFKPPTQTIRLNALQTLPNMEHILLDHDNERRKLGNTKTVVNMSSAYKIESKGTMRSLFPKLAQQNIDMLCTLFSKSETELRSTYLNDSRRGGRCVAEVAGSSLAADREETDATASGNEGGMSDTEDSPRPSTASKVSNNSHSSSSSSSSSHSSKAHEQSVYTCFLPLIHPYPKSQCWLSIPRNIRTEDQPVLRYVPYFGDEDTTGADLSNYENSEIEQELAFEAFEILIHFMFEKHQVPAYKDSTKEGAVAVRPEVLSALENVMDITARQCVKCYERYSEGLLANLKLKNSNVAKTYQSLLLMYCRPQMIDLNGYITPSYSNFDFPNSFLGIKGNEDGLFDSIANSYSELFCRQCYKFMCGMHEYKGNYQNVKKNRQDSSHHISLTYNAYNNPAPDVHYVIPGMALPLSLLSSSARVEKLRKSNVEYNDPTSSSSNLSQKRKIDALSDLKHMMTVPILEDPLSRSSSITIMNSSGEVSPTSESSISLNELTDFQNMGNVNSDSNANANSSDLVNFNFISPTCKPCLPLYSVPHDGVSPRDWHEVERALLEKLLNIYGPRRPGVIAMLLGTRSESEVGEFLISNNLDVEEEDKKSIKSTAAKGAAKLKNVHHSAKEIYPCNHEGPCTLENCSCMQNENYCEKYCACSRNCERRFPGCKCRGDCKTQKCPCMASSRECDPDLCFSCGVSVHPALQTSINAAQTAFINSAPFNEENNTVPIICCKNMSIRNGLGKRIYQGRSGIHGWGAYLLEKAEKNDFICEYRGEMISHEEAERRGRIYDKLDSSFLFDLNDDTCLDSTRKGNKAKFVNHSMDPNCYSKIIVVSGDHKIALFAKKPISPGEELCFNYTYKETCAPLWAITKKDDFLK